MPTVLRQGPYRFFFYAGDEAEPQHVHVESGDNTAKFWLVPVRLANSGGFNGRAIRAIESIIEEHRETLLEAWRDYFKG